MIAHMSRKTWLFIIVIMTLLVGLLAGITSAQDNLRGDIDAPQVNCGNGEISVTGLEPKQITSGTTTTITVIGEGFVSGTVRVAISGLASLETVVNPFGRRAAGQVPAGIAPGNYLVRIEYTDCPDPGDTGFVDGPPGVMTLSVLAEPQPIPTFEIPDPPTAVPGSPVLLARNFVASPPNIRPGGTTTLTFEVVNTGNRTAEGIIASLETGGSFVPAGGQSSVTLNSLFPGASTSVSLTVVASGSAEPGPTSVPVVLTFRDFTGENYTTNVALSVTIDRVTEVAQLILGSYTFNPDPVVPGAPVTVKVEITNSGTDAALQSLFSLTGDSNILLAGPRGDRFPMGDIPPGGTVVLELPMIVSSAAKSGPQSQPFNVQYFRKGEAQETAGSMTITVAAVVQVAPIMLLDSYEIDKDPLAPGEEFTMSVILKNVGAVTAQGILVTFGTVESSTDSGDDDGDGGGSTTSTTPSATFAPLGSGGTMFIGDVASTSETSFDQSFIVSGSATSGIYSLPITLRYQKPDGSTAQDNLRASVVVIAPPTIRIDLLNPVPEQVNVGEPLVLSFELANTGTAKVSLTNTVSEAENGEVVEGAEIFLGDVAANDTAAYNAVVIPSEEGDVTVTVRFGYKDALNKDRQLVETYTALAVPPPPPIDEGPPIDIPEQPIDEPEAPSDVLGRLLLGLLGLGN